jgi:hypothetical protein
MATYNFTFAIPSSDLTGIALNSNSVTYLNTYQVVTTYGNGNVMSSASSNKVVVSINMMEGGGDIRLSTFGMTCSFQDNNVALDSIFTKIGTSPTSTTISSQVGGNTPLVGTPITFNYQLATYPATNLPYLQVIATVTTGSPLYGKFWAKNVFPGIISSLFTVNNNISSSNYAVSNVNPNPQKGARNIIYPVNSTASNPAPFTNPNNHISSTTSINNLEIVGTLSITPPVNSFATTFLSQKITNKSGNIMYKLPPIVKILK